jgi:hypothetical protein
MNPEEAGLRTRDACDRIRAAGYPMLAHVAWSWWLNCADPTYTNNILDLERDAERLERRREPPIHRHPKSAHGKPKEGA